MFSFFAMMSSAALLWLTTDTLSTCLGSYGACGTPCASSSMALLLAPVLLVLPFVKLLWAKNLAPSGLIGRCAVTCAGLTWVVAISVLVHTGKLLV